MDRKASKNRARWESDSAVKGGKLSDEIRPWIEICRRLWRERVQVPVGGLWSGRELYSDNRSLVGASREEKKLFDVTDTE
jgi:hypothetical protein